MFQNIALVIHPDRSEARAFALHAADWFAARGIRCAELNARTEGDFSTDLILSFGGDGTFLIGARYAMALHVPLMGINFGTVGFLTEEEPEQLDSALEAILNGRTYIEERSLLRAEDVRHGREHLALNDVVITRGGYARLIRVECTVNGEQYGVFTADGMIAATPTGSTGYSLSAGGPIVEPGMNCITLTPVCAHSLAQCPCIVSGSSRISFRLQPDRRQTAELQIDGLNMGTLEAGDEIRVTGADEKIRLLRIRPYHFFSLLNQKLTEWGSRHD